MLFVSLTGALLFIAGVVYMAAVAIYRGRMSDPGADPSDPATLEPRHRGVGFLGWKANWPGIAMIVLGALLLLLPTL
jgi:hypothetical protein